MSGELDPNAMLFGGEEDGKTEEERAVEYVYGKNPNRVSALNDLWFDELLKKIESLDLPDEKAKIKMAFKLTAGAVLDMLADSQPPEAAPDVMSDFDIFMGVALTNKKFNVSLFEEQQKALMQIDREKFHDDEEYARRYVETRKGSSGKYLLRQKMRTLGLDADTIDEAVSSVPIEDQVSAARALLERKLEHDDRPEALRRAVQAVMRRGFAYDAVRAAADAYKEELQWDE